MKYALTIIMLCSVFHAHGMFKFTAGTEQQITKMLIQMEQVAHENNLAENPAAKVYASMKTTIQDSGVQNLVAQQAANRWMTTMHITYKTDPKYIDRLAAAQALSKQKPNDADTKSAWREVMLVTLASITQTTENNSSFKCPRTQDPDYRVQFKHILDSNQDLNSNDSDVVIASNLMTYYQMQERTELMQLAASNQ